MSIINKILSSLDRIIGGIPKKSTAMIRQIFFTIVFICVIGGLIYGIIAGKNAAHKTGIRIINETDDVFDIERRLERGDDPGFAGVGEAEYITERAASDYRKDEIRTNERLLPENREFVVEAPRDVKVRQSFDESSDKERLAEISPVDNSKPESEVSRIERETRISETKPGVIMKDKAPPLEPAKEKPVKERKLRGGSDENRVAPLKERDIIVE